MAVSRFGGAIRWARVGQFLLGAVGLVAVAGGSYVHWSVRNAGHGAEPWHPLLVVTPLVGGSLAVVIAVLWARSTARSR